MSGDRKNTEIKLRGNVKKYLPLFINYVKAHGHEAIKELLTTGKTGKYVLKLPLNTKDRFQMMQMLDMK